MTNSGVAYFWLVMTKSKEKGWGKLYYSVLLLSLFPKHFKLQCNESFTFDHNVILRLRVPSKIKYTSLGHSLSVQPEHFCRTLGYSPVHMWHVLPHYSCVMCRDGGSGCRGWRLRSWSLLPWEFSAPHLGLWDWNSRSAYKSVPFMECWSARSFLCVLFVWILGFKTIPQD